MFSNNYSKNREKKNEPNKKENLKNVLMHNCFPKPPVLKQKNTVSLVPKKTERKIKNQIKKENLKNVLNDGLHKPLINGGLRPPHSKN